jgi:hypothetical protein
MAAYASEPLWPPTHQSRYGRLRIRAVMAAYAALTSGWGLRYLAAVWP